MTRAAGRSRFIVTLVVAVSLLLDLVAAFIGGEPGTVRNATLMVAIGVFMAVGVVFALPVGCLYYTFMGKRVGIERKPMTPGFLMVEAIVPFFGTVPAWIIALTLGFRVIGIGAAVATVLLAALLWPTEKRLDLVIRGEAKVLFPVQNAVSQG
jgi:hypothetical protein